MNGGDVVGFLVVGALFTAGEVGWVMNIVKAIAMGTDQLGLLVMRVVGVIFPPLGAVLGYI